MLRLFVILSLMPVGSALAANYTTRIIGGSDADMGEWPTVVQILENAGSGDLYRCGGTLIADRWVLTAAHCFENDAAALETTPASYRVLVNSNGVINEGVPMDVESILVHPEYRQVNAYDADIALIELKSNVTNPSLQMLYFGTPSSECKATIVGYGATSSQTSDTASTTLKEAELPIVEDSVCVTAMSSDVTDNMICAGYKQGGTDTCQGDSGGPLLVEQDDVFRQVGITSWGPAVCGSADQYGVYTRVGNFQDWIMGQTGLTDFAPVSGSSCVLPVEPVPTDSGIEPREIASASGGGSLGWALLPMLGLFGFRGK